MIETSCAAPGGTILEQRLASLKRLVGATPLLELRCSWRGRERVIYAKYESQNFTGSIKDRMALHILEVAYASGEIKPGDTIAEATSGNTGISLAAIGRALGHSVRIFMPDWMSRERVQVIRSLGASVAHVSAEQGGFQGAIEMSAEYARSRTDVFLPRQFESAANRAAHRRTTGPEILEQLGALGLTPTAFVAGVGTGGTVMGVGECLRAHSADIKVHPLEPANSPTLRTGTRVGKHRIQGISDEFIPAVVCLDELDEIIDVWDGDAIILTQRLASELGLGLGISSGANLLGALQVAERQGDDAVVVTVLPDCNKKYLSTDLCAEEEALEHYLSPEVELLGCRVLPRPRSGAPV